jgi:energy-coupling factor transporter ATP-binding protein EcfA2
LDSLSRRENDRDGLAWLREILTASDSGFFLLTGPTGAGKSSLLRALVPGLPGTKGFLLYQLSGMQSTGKLVALRMMLIAPSSLRLRLEGKAPPTGTSRGETVPPASEVEIPEPITALISRMLSTGGGWIVVDSWDRGSEAYYRAQAGSGAVATTFNATPSQIQMIDDSILSTSLHLLLSISTHITQLQTKPDLTIALDHETWEESTLRVLRITDAGRHKVPWRNCLYSVENGVFRPLPPLPLSFKMPHGPPDPDPEPDAPTLWPGRVSFLPVIGRIRYGDLVLMSMAKSCPESLAQVLVLPLAAHVLRTDGKVMWFPGSSSSPSKIIEILGRFVPRECLLDRLRILSVAPPDPGLGDLRRVLLPLTREIGTGNDLRAATSPGVTPHFPMVAQFLRTAMGKGPTLLLHSYEAVALASATVNVRFDPTALPPLIASFQVIPKFCGVGYAYESDPSLLAMWPSANNIFRLEQVYGRQVIRRLRPDPAAFVTDWAPGKDTVDVVPIA